MSTNTLRPVKRRNGSKHDKTGCITCRYRRKKCIQNTYPVCGECARLNLECVREPIRHVVPDEKVKERTNRGNQPRRPTIPQSVEKSPKQTDLKNGGERALQRRYAMNYYITVLSELLTVSRECNSFLSAFLPMAVDSPALADALVSWSSGHLAAANASYRVTALEARSTALHALTETISSAPDDLTCCETNVATCLVLLTSEVCLGDHTGWYCHLKGVKNMILSAQSSGGQGTHFRGTDALRQSPEGQWILRNFAYHDVLGSVTLVAKPLIKAEYLEGLTGVVDTYLGVASAILMLISEISCLEPMELVYEYVDESDNSPFVFLGDRYASLERRIKGWKCQLDTAPTLGAVAYAYRSAALLYLYRRILRALDDGPHRREELSWMINSRIQIEVARVLEHVCDVPLNDKPETALLFPVFMAGAEATKGNHIEIVRMRLVIMQGKRPFHNISRALQVLEGLWTRRQNHSDVDWKDFVEQQPGGLLLT